MTHELKKVMMCTDKYFFFKKNTAIFHKKTRIVHFNFIRTFLKMAVVDVIHQRVKSVFT